MKPEKVYKVPIAMSFSALFNTLKNRVLRTRFLSLLLREWLWLLLILPALCIGLSRTYGISLLDNFVYDRLLSAHTQPVDERIVIVEIDEQSLAQQGAWPWPRSTHAQFLNQLAQAQPKSVLLDLIFAEPSVQAADDELLAQALQKFPHIALPVLLLPQGSKSIDADNTVYTEVLPIDLLAQHAQLGHIMAQTDSDNVLRSIDKHMRSNQTVYPALAAQASMMSHALDASAQPRALIPYIAPVGSYPRVAYSDVLAGRVPNEMFAQRFVLVGAGAAGLGDQYSTPFGTMTGVEIQAVVLDGLLNQRTITAVDGWLAWMLMVAPIVLLLVGFLWLHERYQLSFFVSVLCAHALAVVGLLWLLGIWLPPVATALVLLLTYILWSWRRLSAAVRYFDGEIRNVAQSPNQLSALLNHLAPESFKPTARRRRRSLDVLIQQVCDLQHFITHSLLQAQPMAILIFDDAGDVILSNQKAQQIVGQTQDNVRSLLGKFDADVAHWPQWSEGGYAGLTGLELKGRHDAALHIYQLQCSAVNMEGIGATWLLSLIDLTDERELQRQSAESIQFLSHDLRTPQVNIMSLLQLHQYDAVAMPVDKMMAQVAQNVQRTLTLAENLVLLTHAKTGDYRFIDLNLVQILPFAIEQVWAQAQSKQIRVEYDAPAQSGLFWLRADGDLIERALINLLTNAIRYSSPNTVVRVTVDAIDDGHVSCSVIDQGCGMNAAQIESMMSGWPVEHLKNVDAAGSIGVGFSMVRAIVKGHDGQVSVKSQIGVGTEVTLRFKSVV